MVLVGVLIKNTSVLLYKGVEAETLSSRCQLHGAPSIGSRKTS